MDTRYSRMPCKQLRNTHRTLTLSRVTQEVGFEPALDQESRMRIQRAAQSAKVRAHGANVLRFGNDRTAHYVARARGIFGETVHENIDVKLAVLMQARKRIVQHRERTAG